MVAWKQDGCLLGLIALFWCSVVLSFAPQARHARKSTLLPSSNALEVLQARVEEQRRSQLTQALLGLDAGESLVDVTLVGRLDLPSTSNQTISCLVLSSTDSNTARPCLVVPQRDGRAAKLLEFALHRQPLSKSVLLGLNTLLVNRDDALFDNLPWATWSLDPQQRNRDAAGNSIEARFHLGKRDAYYRFLGKDWQGKSLAVGNVALRLKYLVESEDQDEPEQVVLARRLLELQRREVDMDIAGVDAELAVARQQGDDMEQVSELEQQRAELEQQRADLQERLEQLAQGRPSSSWMAQLLDSVADWSTRGGENAAPYRGAMGYAPKLDTKADIDKSYNTYTSPFDLMKEILEDQLKARVIGAVLENTSLLEGTSTVGGALVLQRIMATKTIQAGGQSLQVNDENQDFGNDNVKGGTTILVECDVDEAVGMALACEVPVRTEASLFERSSVMAEPVGESPAPTSVRRVLRRYQTLDPELSVLVEGQASNRSNTERVAPLRIPRTTVSLFDSLFEAPSESSASRRQLFPTDNPIQSLDQYDELSDDGKARTLMTMSNFEGRLPRPRVLRLAKKEKKESPLDDLLLPLIDESVRRQYLIRDAKKRGDTQRVQEMEEQKSRRQIAQEKAEEARLVGEDLVAAWWEEEARLYDSLRADATQDEGSYSRFL